MIRKYTTLAVFPTDCMNPAIVPLIHQSAQNEQPRIHDGRDDRRGKHRRVLIFLYDEPIRVTCSQPRRDRFDKAEDRREGQVAAKRDKR